MSISCLRPPRRPSLPATLLTLTGILMLTGSLLGGPDEDWAKILELEKGPKELPESASEAKDLARAHFAKHDAALRAFIADYPQDPRAYDAQVRQASILATVGKMEGDQSKVDAALRKFSVLEKVEGVPRGKLADVAFRRVSLYIQSIRPEGPRARDNILTSIRNYAARFPDDRRAARLLVEGATLLDSDPVEKRALLSQAASLTREPELKDRIADDFRRLDQLGKPVELRLSTLQGEPIDTAPFRGRVVAILFWAAESPHCRLWLEGFRKYVQSLNSSSLEIVTVSLDENQEALEAALADEGIDWPTHFTGQGWETPVARRLGINALPTLWLLDRSGNLVTLNARENYEAWLKKLLLAR